MQDIYSHPPSKEKNGTQLIEHSENVASRVEKLLSKNSKFGYKVGLMHDIGKATSYFQQYIGVRDGSPSEQYTRHSLIGSLISSIYYVKRDEVYKSAVSFAVIDSHHSEARNIYDRMDSHINMSDEMYERLRAQYYDIIENNESRKVVSRLIPGDDNIDDKEYKAVFDSFSKLKGICRVCANYVREVTPNNIQDIEDTESRLYQQYLMLHGAIVFADKTNVAGLKHDDIFRESSFSYSDVDEYVKTELSPPNSESSCENPAEKINYYRELARKEAIENLDVEESSGVHTIHLPTGFGKTLTSLSVALRLMEEKEQSQVVYALPLTTIIDQTADTICDVFSDDRDLDTSKTPNLTVHHHLSDTETDIERLESERSVSNIRGYEPDTLYSETWLSDITVTTFVQLFSTLVGPRNSQSMKLGAMHNKVIIIDEIQSLPTRWWGIITSLLETLVEEYNCNVVSITATHPEIYERDFCSLNPQSIVEPAKYYDFLEQNERVSFESHKSAKSYMSNSLDEPIETDKLASMVADSNEDSVAAIVNTISDAKSTYREIDSKLDSSISLNKFIQDNIETLTKNKSNLRNRLSDIEGESVIANVTTRLRPIDRRLIVNSIEQLLNTDTQLYVVATQVFEAGVDISFDRIFRDICPASSVVQTAGRCNREFKSSTGTLTIVYVNNDKGSMSSAESVYQESPELLRRLIDLQIGEDATEKSVIYDGVQRYFNSVFASDDTDGFVYGDQSLLLQYHKAKGGNLVEESIINSSKSYDIIIPTSERMAKNLNSDISEMNPYSLIEKYQDVSVSIPSYSLDNDSVDILTETLKLDDMSPVNVDETAWICTVSEPSFYDDLGINTEKSQETSGSHYSL